MLHVFDFNYISKIPNSISSETCWILNWNEEGFIKTPVNPVNQEYVMYIGTENKPDTHRKQKGR